MTRLVNQTRPTVDILDQAKEIVPEQLSQVKDTVSKISLVKQ